jgi:hypothetical protein
MAEAFQPSGANNITTRVQGFPFADDEATTRMRKQILLYSRLAQTKARGIIDGY